MSSKLPSYEPGQIVSDLRGGHYKVVSKVASPEGVVLRFADMQGQPASDVIPVSSAFARFASMVHFHLAYNKDLDLYIRAYCEKAKLPIPVGLDNQPFRWADWFQSKIVPKLYSPVKDPEAAEAIKDEAIHEMVFTMLHQRKALEKFREKIKKFRKKNPETGKYNDYVKNMPVARQLTVYLTSVFSYRVEEMNRKIMEQMPPEEISMVQPGESESGEVNILETEEHAHSPAEFQTVESEHDIAKFRNGFYKWLKKHQTENAAQRFIQLFDIYWQITSEATGKKDEETGRPSYLPARRELEEPWSQATRLSNPALYDYIGRLAVLLERYISENRHTLGEDNIFVKLIDSILHQREKLRTKKQPVAASVKTAKRVRGDELTPEMRQQVVDAFSYRWTSDSPHAGKRNPCPNCDIRNPFVGGSSEGHNHPTIPLQTDDQWIAEHAFNFTNDGRLMTRGGAMPAYMGGPGANPVLLSQAVLDDREEQDQALVDRVKSGAFESVTFPEEHVKENLDERELDELGLHEIDPRTERKKEYEDIRLHGTRASGKTGAAHLAAVNLIEAIINILEARSDNMLTALDWEILQEAVDARKLPPMVQLAAGKLLEAHDQEPPMVTSAEWLALQQAFEEASGRHVEWRTADELSDEEWKQQHGDKEAGIGHEFYDGIRPQITPGDTGRLPHGRTQGSLKAATGEQSEISREEYPAQFLIADEFGGEVHPFDVYQGPYVEVKDLGRFFIVPDDAGLFGFVWNERNDTQSVEMVELADGSGAIDAFLQTLDSKDRRALTKDMNRKYKKETPGQTEMFAADDSAADSSDGTGTGPTTPQEMLSQNVQNAQGTGTQPEEVEESETQRNRPAVPWGLNSEFAPPRMAAAAAGGPATPQQMMTQNVQKSQGIEPTGTQPPPNVAPQRPGTSVAITPESGYGEDAPMRKTVPPELANANFHMSSVHMAGDEALFVDRRKFFENVRRKVAGHFYTEVKGKGRDRREAQQDAISNFKYDEDELDRHDIRGITKAKFIKKVPPTKTVIENRGGIDYIVEREDPDAPQDKWLEVWEFEIHSHA